MSDSFGYTPGASATENGAADRIGGLLFQRVKMTFGPDGTALDVSSGDPLPVSVASLPLPAGAATQATLATVAGAVFVTDAASAPGDRGMLQLGVRRDADGTQTNADGDYEALQINAVGRLKVSAQPALAPLTTGNITANAQTVFCDTRRQSNVMVHMVAASLVGHNVTFEGSIDSTNGTDGAWFAIQAIRSNANTIELVTGVLAATPTYGWELSVNGLAWIRVRATGHTSGTATWKFQPAPYATEPIPGAQVSGTQPVSGTVTANIGTGALAAGTNAIGDVGLQARANATGAPAPVPVNSPATPVGQIIKASAGRLMVMKLRNTSASARFVKFFNLATAATMGTTSALFEYAIPAGGELNIDTPIGIGFSAGIQVAITAAAGLTNAGAITAGDVVGFAAFA